MAAATRVGKPRRMIAIEGGTRRHGSSLMIEYSSAEPGRAARRAPIDGCKEMTCGSVWYCCGAIHGAVHGDGHQRGQAHRGQHQRQKGYAQAQQDADHRRQ